VATRAEQPINPCGGVSRKAVRIVKRWFSTEGLQFRPSLSPYIDASLRTFQMYATLVGGAFWFLVAILFWNVPRRIFRGLLKHNVEFEDGRTIRSRLDHLQQIL